MDLSSISETSDFLNALIHKKDNVKLFIVICTGLSLLLTIACVFTALITKEIHGKSIEPSIYIVIIVLIQASANVVFLNEQPPKQSQTNT